MLNIQSEGNSGSLNLCGSPLLVWGGSFPMIYIGTGVESVDMYRGNFEIEDYITERVPLDVEMCTAFDGGVSVSFARGVQMDITLHGDYAVLSFKCTHPEVNRFWMRVCAQKDEHVYGCGEQMSYFDMRGKQFPLWTSEPGVGRDKTTYVTWRSDVENKAGGDYYNTCYPQPTYASSRHYYLDVDSTAYANFDFRNEKFHELQLWDVPRMVRIEAALTWPDLLEKMTAYFGRQQDLPDWLYNGLVIGVQGGSERSFGLLERTLAHGIKVAGVWCQDWCGKRVTSFGKRLQWDWHYNEEMYPNLPGKIEELHKRGIRFLAYTNPFLVKGGMLYEEGLEKGALARKSDGSVCLVDFGEFDCGVVDLTNPAAFNWFKEVVKKYLIGIGIDGWMADFGEYLPVGDIVLHSGRSAMLEHNRWPVLWAECNYRALEETGKFGEIFYFMRAAGRGSQKYAVSLWAGDQSVDFSRHDGLCTVICAALSSGMTGCGLTHCDIGGYTSLFGNFRTKEVFLRWAEMAVFSPVMRTHEGNRPEENFQYYSDDECMNRLARLVNIYTELAPYTKACVKENSVCGLPVQRPLFVHYEDDERCMTEQFEYLFGRDILAAPVWREGKEDWEVYLPDDEWVHFWTGREYGKGVHTVEAKLGDPPAFYRKSSDWAELFAKIGREYITL